MNNCYKNDQQKTFKLLSRIQDTDYWSNVTCLEIAERARCRKFIAQEPCQNFADRIWRGLDPFSRKKESVKDFTPYLLMTVIACMNAVRDVVCLFICVYICVCMNACDDNIHNEENEDLTSSS